MAQLKEDYQDDVRVVFRHFPLSFHDKAATAVQAAEAAGMQGKFWEMHDLLFERLGEWSSLSVEEFQDWVTEAAQELELDVEQFSKDLTSQETADIAKQAWETNSEIGIPGTPFLIINGQPYQGNLSYDGLSSIIDVTLFEQQHYEECPPMTIDPQKEYVAKLETDKGDIEIELYAEEAPLAVNSFIALAKDGWYENNPFITHADFVFSGDPSDTGFGFPGYAFIDETDGTQPIDDAGWLATYATKQNVNGGSFFISRSAMEGQNGRTIFGKVIEGLDVLEQFETRESIFDSVKDQILSITIVEESE